MWISGWRHTLVNRYWICDKTKGFNWSGQNWLASRQTSQSNSLKWLFLWRTFPHLTTTCKCTINCKVQTLYWEIYWETCLNLCVIGTIIHYWSKLRLNYYQETHSSAPVPIFKFLTPYIQRYRITLRHDIYIYIIYIHIYIYIYIYYIWGRGTNCINKMVW